MGEKSGSEVQSAGKGHNQWPEPGLGWDAAGNFVFSGSCSWITGTKFPNSRFPKTLVRNL